MAQGKKYGDELKEQARALLSVNDNVSEVAKCLGLGESTVRSWKNKFETEKGSENLAKLREKKKEQFVKSAWKTIGKLNKLIDSRVDRALKQEELLDTLLDEVERLPREELTEADRRSLRAKISAIKVEDLSKLSTVLGTLYDKQALACKDATEVIEGQLDSKRVEDFDD
ncbi:MAG: hypothetical protein IJ344_01140 [Clostridia bacterium]|nr:hypothetical protein [Clostridia bacterium]